jgi:hypothetical protein
MKTKIICPNCKCIDTFPNDKAKLDYWVDNNNIFHWNCFECEYEWLGDYHGNKLETQNQQKPDKIVTVRQPTSELKSSLDNVDTQDGMETLGESPALGFNLYDKKLGKDFDKKGFFKEEEVKQALSNFQEDVINEYSMKTSARFRFYRILIKHFGKLIE